MKISICGSMHHIDGIEEAQAVLERQGWEVETPSRRENKKVLSEMSRDELANEKDFLIREHLEKIRHSDAVLIYNEEKRGVDGYIGGNTLMEMAFAYAQDLEIFLFKPIPEMSYTDEILGMKPIVLNGDIDEIQRHYDALPKTFLSSKSPIKLRAVSRAMRRAGIRTMVIAKPTESNVSEQPKNLEETYEGALNRQNALKTAAKTEAPDYLATVESGLYQIHPDHNSFSSTLVIIEKVGGSQKVGVNVELEYPREMTDKVPSVYPDLGVLVQDEYGSKLKDPFPYFTNGKVDRLQLVETAVFNVAAQLPKE
jgi:non-canonical (house-cleaning) NTP pyrophosphatase